MRKRMLKKILKWTGIVVGTLIAVLLIANAVFVWRSGAALETRLQAIRDAGHPVCLADLAPEPIPAEKDAAVYYHRAEKDLLAIGKELETVRSSDAWPDGPLTEEQLKSIERAIDAYPDVFPLVQKVAACPTFSSGGDYQGTGAEFLAKNLETIQSYRGIPRYLSDRSLLLAARGDREEALKSCVLSLQLARRVERLPSLVSHLVADAVRAMSITVANRVLRSGAIDDTARGALDAELAQHDLTASYRRALITERAMGLSMFHEFNDWGLLRLWFIRGFWNNGLIYYLDVMDRQLTLASQPYPQVLRADSNAVSKPIWSLLTDLVSPGITAAREALERSRAMIRCLRIVNAVTRREQQGVATTGLADLKLPQEQTIDPFTGKPLLMKKRSDGWVVYSVGRNLKDDEGRLDDQSDAGLSSVPPLPSLE